ncbi:MAG: JAB domain-containing protein [Paludibacteraceae bacterium]|nr:JAB domain-containing protein [Paludibacteraceae bacterium]
MEEKIKISSSSIAYEFARDVFKGLDHEELWILYVNDIYQPISFERVTSGGWSSTIIDLRQIFSIGLKHHSTGIFLFHNHLSGNCSPSISDINKTRDVSKIGKILEMPMIDHIIISDKVYYSFADEVFTPIKKK